jgi:hypothetical protein
MFFGKFYVGELYTVDSGNIFESETKSNLDSLTDSNQNKKEKNQKIGLKELQFCPISIHGSTYSINGLILSRCVEEPEYTLYWFFYSETLMFFLSADLPEDIKSLDEIYLAYELTPVLYSPGLNFFYQLIFNEDERSYEFQKIELSLFGLENVQKMQYLNGILHLVCTEIDQTS